MGVRLISYPFRLDAPGNVATVEEGSDENNAELIAVLVLTRPGEREMVAEFGVDDPTFDELSIGDVIAGVAMFGPPVTITDIDVRYPTDTSSEVDIAFEGEG